MGEVPSLSDFFSEIDIFITSNPKGCGILNRVLDAFVYHVPVLGHENSFSGFPDSDKICYKFTSYKSFEAVMTSLTNNLDEAHERADNAILYVKDNHNWERNYNDLIEEILVCLNI